LENRTLREQAFEYLREEILTSRLAPGTELSEVALAQALGTSRGPLREALGRLAAEGLVRIVPRRGAVVTKLTRREFLDTYEVREALETLAVRRAVPRLGDEDRATLREMCGEMERLADAGDAHGFFAVNRRFHIAFVAASGNQRLAQMHSQLLDEMGRLMAKSQELRGGMRKSVDEHREILAAAGAGDAERAAALMAAHIQVPQRVLDAPEAAELFDDDPEPEDRARFTN
jgi:DNA-binding GntR family transcriptional regulator